jgi:hypothetical protein
VIFADVRKVRFWRTVHGAREEAVADFAEAGFPASPNSDYEKIFA